MLDFLAYPSSSSLSSVSSLKAAAAEEGEMNCWKTWECRKIGFDATLCKNVRSLRRSISHHGNPFSLLLSLFFGDGALSLAGTAGISLSSGNCDRKRLASCLKSQWRRAAWYKVGSSASSLLKFLVSMTK